MNNNNNIDEHSLLKSILLHFMPAIIWLAFYIPLARLARDTNIPTMFVMYVLAALVLVPVELGYLYCLGKKKSGRFTLKEVVFFRQAMPWWQYPAFGLVIATWILLVFLGIGAQSAELLRVHVFFWVPDWFFLNRGVPEDNGPFIETTIWVCGLIFIGLVGPLTEELYFRGYLLPRLKGFGKWAPLLNVVLFSAYHFWQPHYCVITVIAMLPFVYCVWWKRNVYLGIGVHCCLNTFGWLTELIQRLSTSTQ